MKDFSRIVSEHSGRYPEMDPQDYGKLAFQSEFGPEHMAPAPAQVQKYLAQEWSEVTAPACVAENIGNGLCRLHLGGAPDRAAIELLTGLFLLTAGRHRGSAAGLEERLRCLKELGIPGMDQWLTDYRAEGCPAVHHSERFRAAYEPHYRVIAMEYARWFPALLAVQRCMCEKGRAMVAIDGRCGSGKTGLATVLHEVFGCAVFHADDFYLPLDRRLENWEEVPAGNMDLERFLSEVISPARAGEVVSYRPFDCQSGMLLPETQILPNRLTVVEGSYSHHPALAEYYDLKLFVTCDTEERGRRLRAREGDYYPMFLRRWIPMEERYFERFTIEECSDLVVDTTEFFL